MAKITRGERFKDARTVYNQHKKQTMDEVAIATGVSKSLIQSLEDDDIKRSVGYDKVAKLAAHYHVTSDYLLGLSDDPFPEHSAVDDLGLSPKVVKTLQQIKRISSEHNDYLAFYNEVLASDSFQTVMSSAFKFVQAAVADDIYQTERANHFAQYGPLEGCNRIAEFYEKVYESAVSQEDKLLISNVLRYFLLLDKLNTDHDNELILPDASITPAVIYGTYKSAPMEAFELMLRNLATAHIHEVHNQTGA